MDNRGNCWSITINNPKESDYTQQLPAGWALTGQLEVGKEGTPHYQGMLTTPQIRFSAVKKVFTTAHIEKAKNKNALSKYVHKDDTRIASVGDNVSNIPTLFSYQHTVAQVWDDDEWATFRDKHQEIDNKMTEGDIALNYVDLLVSRDIENGACGVEYIAVNPMWRSSWKKFWRSMVVREQKYLDVQDQINSTVE